MAEISGAINISRKDMAEFLPDSRAVKQFENLQNTLNAITNIVVNEAPVIAGDVAAQVNANEAQILALANLAGQDPTPQDDSAIAAIVAGLMQTPVAAEAPGTATTRTITASETALPNDYFVAADCTGGAVTYTLPAAAAVAGRTFIAKKIDAGANALTIEGGGAETIDGAANVSTTTQYASYSVLSDGTQWWIV